LITGETDLFFKHIIALGIVAIYTFGGSLLLYKIVGFITPMRVSAEQEELGLDISQHKEQIALG